MSEKITAEMIKNALKENIVFEPNLHIKNILKEIDKRIHTLFESIKRSNGEDKKKIKTIVSYGSTKELSKEEKKYISENYSKDGFNVSFEEVKYSDPHDVFYLHGKAPTTSGVKIQLKIK